MDYVSYESYYIKDEELHVLLAGIGKCTWYGLTDTQTHEPIKNIDDIHRILAGLYQKEYITWAMDKVVILEPIYSMIQVMLHAKVCMNARIMNNRIPLRCHYFYRDQVLFMERSQRENNMLRLTMIGYREWMDLLFQESYFPENVWDRVGEIPAFDQVLESEKTLLECCLDNECYAGFEKVDINSGKVIERLFVRELNFVYTLLLQQENLSICREYSCWREILQQWLIQEECHDFS